MIVIEKEEGITMKKSVGRKIVLMLSVLGLLVILASILTKSSKNSPILYRWRDELQKIKKNTCSGAKNVL